MANRNKRRGYELEKEVQDFFRENGVPAKRVFGSGAFKAASPDLEGDVRILNYLVERKRRKDGFKNLYSWLAHDNADFLCLRSDRNPRLWVLREPTLLKFLKKELENNE